MESITLPNNLSSIGQFLFYNCTDLTAITIPNSVKSIGEAAFSGCTGLKSIMIPNNVTSIRKAAFWGCSLNCLTINSSDNPFDVNSYGDGVLFGCKLGSIIWEPSAPFPSKESDYLYSNCLLYVKSLSYAPGSVRNVIVNGEASLITLSDDGGLFFFPQTFTTKKITYSHNYIMETGGSGKGWETIVLPFDVQKVIHNNNGELVPFASLNPKSDKKPFWLYQFNGNNFQRASTIQANKPYLISMPNQTSYNKEYNLSGEVTFTAEYVEIPITPEPSGYFVPAYSLVEKSESVKVLNVVNKNVSETGDYDAGSRFISNLRDVLPFECYFKGSASTRDVGEMIEREFSGVE